jgi:hypothetical protein
MLKSLLDEGYTKSLEGIKAYKEIHLLKYKVKSLLYKLNADERDKMIEYIKKYNDDFNKNIYETRETVNRLRRYDWTTESKIDVFNEYINCYGLYMKTTVA